MGLMRIAGFGVLLWVLVFFEISVLMFGFGFTEPLISYLHFIILIPFAILVAWLYFRGPDVKRGLNEGILAGVGFLIVGFVLDLVITVLLFTKDLGFFADPYLWIGFAEMIVIVALVGVFMRKP